MAHGDQGAGDQGGVITRKPRAAGFFNAGALDSRLCGNDDYGAETKAPPFTCKIAAP
jgi:hypothetical protein